MYGGTSNMQDHPASPRLSAFFNSIDRSCTSPTSTTPQNSSRQSFVSTASRCVSIETNETLQSAPTVLMHTTSTNLIDAADGTTAHPRQQQQQRRRVTIQSDQNNTGTSSSNHRSSINESSKGSGSSSPLSSRSSRFRISSRYGSSSYKIDSPGSDRSTKSNL